MEIRANYLVVGGFVLVLVAGMVAFVLWLAKIQFDAEFARYDVRFSGNVTGLRMGSSVSYRGIPVGEVIDVRIDPERIQEVVVTIEVPANTPVLEDTVATLQLQGITGAVDVLLTGGTQGAQPLAAKPGEKYPVISSRQSGLQQVFEGAPELVASLNVLVARATAIMGPENQRTLGETLDNLSVFTAALADRSDDIQLLLNDAAGTMANLRDATAALERLANQLSVSSQSTLEAIEEAADVVADNREEINALVADMRQTADAFTDMANEIEVLVSDVRPPLRDFSNGALYELSSLFTEARELINGLNRVTTEVERDPARFLFGDQQQGYETVE
ncbi:MAG: MlaD family protein [Alphaproteobacteria bacterium]